MKRTIIDKTIQAASDEWSYALKQKPAFENHLARELKLEKRKYECDYCGLRQTLLEARVSTQMIPTHISYDASLFINNYDDFEDKRSAESDDLKELCGKVDWSIATDEIGETEFFVYHTIRGSVTSWNCAECRNAHISICTFYVLFIAGGKYYDTQNIRIVEAPNIFAASNGILLPRAKPIKNLHLLPNHINATVREAHSVLPFSPSAAAVLSRKALQALLRHIFSIPKNKQGNLASEINLVSEEMDIGLLEAISNARKIGNIGAHFDRDTDKLIDVTEQEAAALIQLNDFIFDDYIGRAERRKILLEKVSEATSRK